MYTPSSDGTGHKYHTRDSDRTELTTTIWALLCETVLESRRTPTIKVNEYLPGLHEIDCDMDQALKVLEQHYYCYREDDDLVIHIDEEIELDSTHPRVGCDRRITCTLRITYTDDRIVKTTAYSCCFETCMCEQGAQCPISEWAEW